MGSGGIAAGGEQWIMSARLYRLSWQESPIFSLHDAVGGLRVVALVAGIGQHQEQIDQFLHRRMRCGYFVSRVSGCDWRPSEVQVRCRVPGVLEV